MRRAVVGKLSLSGGEELHGTPQRLGYKPTWSDARAGAQIGLLQKALLNVTPRRTNESIAGVRTPKLFTCAEMVS